MFYTILLSFFAYDKCGGSFDNIAPSFEQFFMAIFEGRLSCGYLHPHHFDGIVDIPVA